MVYLIYAIIIASSFFLFIFKDQVRKGFQNNTKSITIAAQSFGIFIIVLSIFRVTILTIGGYPNS
jgi:cytochrome b561